MMRKRIKLGALALALFSTFASGSAYAQGAGDLLVAPTRVVLDGARGTEVILNNIGAAPATYRISLELRRMRPDGSLEEIEQSAANTVEATTLGMISYAPRRVTLPPNQPQSIRIGIRAPQALPDGEYRAHMLFRAIPESKPATPSTGPKDGVSIALTPIYGVTIPIIVRQGNLSAKAAISDARIEPGKERDTFSFGLARTGTRSTYGRVRVIKPGIEKPLIDARGIAVYAELPERRVIFPVDSELAAKLKGPATIQYLEDNDAGGGVIAELQTVIR
jgi:P pilus assembly chaperone PapD